MTNFVVDTFTAADNTTCQTRTPDTGAGTIVRDSDSGGGTNAIILSNMATGSDGGLAYYSYPTLPAGPDGEIIIRCHVTALTSNVMGATYRQTADGTRYLVSLRPGAGGGGSTLISYFINGGGLQDFTATAGLMIVGGDYDLKLRWVGPTHTFKIKKVSDNTWLNAARNDWQATEVVAGTVTDSTITTRGKVGFAVHGVSQVRFDSFSASDVTVSVAYNDTTNEVFSPGNWVDLTTYMMTINTGAYIRGAATLASSSGFVTVNLDCSHMNGVTAANCPRILTRVNNGAWTNTLTAYVANGVVRVFMATGLSAGAITWEILFKSVDLTSTNSMGTRWPATAQAAVRFQGIELPSDATVTVATRRTKKMLILAESIGEGANCISATTLTNAANDASQSFPYLVGIGLQAECGAICFAYLGYTTTGSVDQNFDGSTQAGRTWDSYANTLSRTTAGTFPDTYDYILVMMGSNDSADITSNVTTFLPKLRTAAGANTLIGYLQEPSNAGVDHSSQIQAAIAAVNDPKVRFINTGIAPPFGSVSAMSFDGVHLNYIGQAMFASAVVGLTQAFAASASTQTGTGSIFNTGGGAYAGNYNRFVK